MSAYLPVPCRLGSRKARPTVFAFLHRLAQMPSLLIIPKKGEYIVPEDARVSTMPYVPSTYSWVTLRRKVVAQLLKAVQKYYGASTKLRIENAELLRENAALLIENAELLREKAVLQKVIDPFVIVLD